MKSLAAIALLTIGIALALWAGSLFYEDRYGWSVVVFLLAGTFNTAGLHTNKSVYTKGERA